MTRVRSAPPLTPQWLSDLQIQVAAKMFRDGKNTAEIAKAIGCHEADVERHLGRERDRRWLTEAS